MRPRINDVIGGLQDLVKSNQENKEETLLTLYYFDDYCTLELDERNVKHLDPSRDIKYNIRGNTALIDACVGSIDEVGRKLAAKPESERPNKVIFIIATDGEENASKISTLDDLRRRIKNQADNYKWQFMFMGANIDSFAAAASYNIPMSYTTNVAPTKIGSGLRMAGMKVADYSRSLDPNVLSYSAQDRKDLA